MKENINEEILLKIKGEVGSLLSDKGYECVRADWNDVEKVLGIYLDLFPKQSSAITMEQIVVASRLINQNLNFDPYFQGSYSLEVSSPGV